MDAGPHQPFAHLADLPAAFDELARADAAHPVLHAPDRVVTRGCIARLAAALTGSAAASRWPPHRIIGLAADNGPAFLAGLLAIWRHRCAALLLDGHTPPDRCLATARTLGATALLRCPQPWSLAAADFEWTALADPTARTVPGAAVVKLTSGSTGAPRGILLGAPAVAADTFAVEAAMGIGGDDRVLAAVPMSFSYGFGSLAIPALLRGRELVLPEPGNPLALIAAARQQHATVLPTVPAILGALLKRDPSWSLPASLRLVVSAGAPLYPGVARRFRARFGRAIHAFYGASECGGITYDQRGDAAIRGTVGTPVPGVSIAIEDGVVTVRSPALAHSYLPPHAALDGTRYVTSDEARWRGDELEIAGRRDALIDLGGHKVNPREVEQVIAGMPGVDAVHVTAMPPTAERPGACCAIVESSDASVSRQQVHDWCQQQMPAFKLPRRILIVRELPRTPRGKVAADAIHRLANSGDTSASA